jgi:D-alanyl-lipoteichoic acid acyltransferase DltB (MBOAT superfamily)
MLFNSYIFIFLFLPIVLIGWYGLNRTDHHKTALVFLTGMSLWFYGYFNAAYLILIVVSILGNYAISAVLSLLETRHSSDVTTPGIRRGIFLALGLILNLGLLFYFKYYDFFIENINIIFRTDFNLKHILLPLGISFFTFQQLSFIIDRSLGRADHYGLIEYAAFVTFFPQLIAGPIVLHSELVPQFKETAEKGFDAGAFYDGVISFVLGLSKKVLLADTLAIIVNYGFDTSMYLDTFSAIAVMTAYFLELYFDFSGYSDMAIGLGLMFGIRLPVNFNSPYKASSLKELWNRWHMTLTRFMTTYVYIPLGGSRKGKIRTLINVFIVFILSGLWHGAAWTYVVWGICTGLIVVWDNLEIVRLPKKIGVFITDITFTLLLIPFRSTSLMQAKEIFVDLLGGWRGNLPKMSGTLVQRIPEFYLIRQFFERAFPMHVDLFNTLCILFIIVMGIFVITRKNVAQIIETYRDRSFLRVVVVALFVYCVISFSQVSTFIYFNF